MSVLSARRFRGPGVSPGEAWYAVVIRVSNTGSKTKSWDLRDFYPPALIGPNHYSASTVTGGDLPALSGVFTPGSTETGTFGYSVPSDQAGPQVTIKWVFSDGKMPCTFVGRAS